MNREERMEQHRYRGVAQQRHEQPQPHLAQPEHRFPPGPPQGPPQGPHVSQGRGEAGYTGPSGWTNPGGAYGGGLHGAHGGQGGMGYSSGGYGAQGASGQGYGGYAPYGYGQQGQSGPPGNQPPYGPQGYGQQGFGRPGPGGEHQMPPGGQHPRGEGGGQQQFGQYGPGQHSPPPHSPPQQPPHGGGAGQGIAPMGYSGASYGSEAYAGWASPGTLREQGRAPEQYHPREHLRHRRGPKGYTRSDQRLLEEICDRLVQQVDIDPSDIEVRVQDGIAELEGSVDSRPTKHRVEDIVDSVWGIKDIHNRLRIRRDHDPGPGRGDLPGRNG